MADENTTEFEPEGIYVARVSRPVNVGPLRYLPRDDLRIKGKRLNQIVEENGADAIASAEPV